jgi:MSHA biogenesis protein MshJ
MIGQLKQWEKKFNSLLARERLLMVFSLFAAIYMIFELALLGPAQRKYTQLSADVETQKKQLESLKAEDAVLTKVLTTDPSLLLKKEFENMNVQLDALDKEIIDLSAGLVSANQLASMLQEMLILTDGLQLESLATDVPQSVPLPSDAVARQEKAGKVNKAPVAQLRIYRQYVSLRLKGNYFQILNYLKRLEATRWRFYWEALHYGVIQHPEAVVEMRVYSLSIERHSNE